MKEHWSQFNWGDWFKDPDLAQCRMATRGLWIDAIGRMYSAGTDRVEGRVERLTNTLRCSSIEIIQAALDLAETNTATVLIDGQPILEVRAKRAELMLNECEWLTNGLTNAQLTIICRRLTRELEIKQLRSKAGKIGMAKRYHTNKQNPNTDTQDDGNKSMALVIGSGSPEGSPEGNPTTYTIPPAPAHDPNTGIPTEHFKQAKTMATRILAAFNETPQSAGASVWNTTLGHCVELAACGKPQAGFEDLIDWLTNSPSLHKPKSPQSASDPAHWAKWQTMMRDELAEQEHRNRKRRGSNI